jgi:hypothetical protein
MLKLMYSTDNILGVYFVKYFQVKNGVKVNKCGKPALFAPFLYIPGSFEGLLYFFDSSTTIPGPGTPPTNSQRTKQFWSRPHGL